MRKVAGSFERGRIGGAGWLAMAGREEGSAVLFSSFGEKTAAGTSNIELSTLNIEGVPGLGTFNIELSTLNIEGGKMGIRGLGPGIALRRRDGSAPRGRKSGRSLFTSFGWNLEAKHRRPCPGCSVRLARIPRFGLEETKKLEGKKIRIPIFRFAPSKLSSNHFVIRKGRGKAPRRRDDSAPSGRSFRTEFVHFVLPENGTRTTEHTSPLFTSFCSNQAMSLSTINHSLSTRLYSSFRRNTENFTSLSRSFGEAPSDAVPRNHFHRGAVALHSSPMRQPLFILACVFSALLVTSCSGQSAAEAGKGEGSVWKVESGSTHIYLCGTIHLLRKSDYPLPASYEAAYKDCQRLVFELPPGSQADPKLAGMMQASGSYPSGESLVAKITPETWKALEEWCTKHNTDINAFNRFRPWLAALTIAATEYAAVGAEPGRGVDSVFEEKMNKDHKTGEGLESVELQIGLFSKLTDKQQQQLLEQTLSEVKSLPKQFERMITAWRTGDADGLNQMMFEEAKNYPDLMDIFLVSRNASWIARLQEHLAKKDHVMVLVGAGHLGGDNGVIALLKAKGYKVEKVSVK